MLNEDQSKEQPARKCGLTHLMISSVKEQMVSLDKEKELLREKAARLQAILDTTVDGIITIDERTIVQSFNKAAERIFGYQASEVIGNNVNMLMPSPYRENHNTYIANYLRTGNRKIIGIGREVRGRRKNGSTFPLYLAVSEVWVGNRRIFTGILRDITDIKQAEEDLRKAKDELEERVKERTAQLVATNRRLQQEIEVRRQKEEELKIYTAQLERSNRDLQDFTFVASHDLQEPLRKIQTFSDRMTKTYAECLDEKAHYYLKRMQNAAKVMRDSIQAVLDYSRIATRARPFTLVDLNHVAREVITDLELLIERTNARIHMGNLPRIEADSIQIRQLFSNLIGNSLKFQNTDNPVIRIHGQILSEEVEGHTMSLHSDELCLITIEDNGIGFDEKYLDRIFMPFQRLHVRSSPYGGTGMGLAISRKIVERHHGEITARSEPGVGSKFIISLPLKQPEGI